MEQTTLSTDADSSFDNKPQKFNRLRHYTGRSLFMAARIVAPLMTAYVSYRGYWGVLNTMDTRLNSVLEAIPAKMALENEVGYYCFWTLEDDDSIDLSSSDDFVSGFKTHPEVCHADMPHPDVIEAGTAYFQHKEYRNDTRPELFGAAVGVGMAGIAAVIVASCGAVVIGTDFPPQEIPPQVIN